MGISKLLPHLPGGREKQTRFIHCKHLVAGQKLDIDAGTVMEAPEMEEDFIVSAFAHVGDSSTQKNIVRGLERCLQANTLLYHAITTSKKIP
jgi:hypothetical protein